MTKKHDDLPGANYQAPIFLGHTLETVSRVDSCPHPQFFKWERGVKSTASHKQVGYQKGAWAIELIMLGEPPVQHLIAVDASTGKPLLSEPVQNFAQLNGVLQRAFQRLGAPSEITTDRAVGFFDDSFQNLLESFRVRHIVRTDTLNQGPVERFVRNKSKGKTA
jgi:hypothetical protein